MAYKELNNKYFKITGLPWYILRQSSGQFICEDYSLPPKLKVFSSAKVSAAIVNTKSQALKAAIKEVCRNGVWVMLPQCDAHNCQELCDTVNHSCKMVALIEKSPEIKVYSPEESYTD